MGNDSTAARWIDAGGVSDDVLRRRIRLVLWIVVVANLFFAATDPWLNPGRVAVLSAIKVGVIGAQLVGLAILRRPLRPLAAVVVGLLSGSAAAVGGVVAGVIVHDPFTTPMLCGAGALLTAAVVPWGTGPQIWAAVINLLGGTGTVYLVGAGLPNTGEVILGLLVVNGLSIYIASELARERSAQARATRALERHQAEVAHVLRVSALGEMAAQLAHELTQPLGAIANYAAGCRRRLEASPAGSPDLVDAAERIGREALRAGQIIRRMREFLQKSEPERRAVDVNGLVREVAGLLAGETRERGVKVDLQLQAALPPVQADGVEIEQVLINLARNALEAMQDGTGGSTLVIETRFGPSDAVEVFVRDSGPGLPDGDGEAIFEPFYTTKPRGLGMGLAISRSIVELHGGKLAASSGPAGTTFHFTLPLRAAH